MGDDELKKELQRSYKHSEKAHSQALRIFDRRSENRDALTASTLREDQLFFDRKAKHRLGYEERSREKLKKSPLAANLVIKDSKLGRQRRSDERRQQLQQESADKLRKDDWEARFRGKVAANHQEWELRKLQAEKRENLESEFVLKAQLDAAWSDRDLHTGGSPKRNLRDLQRAFFHGGAFIGPTRGSIRPSKGNFVGPGPESVPPRLRTYSTALPELRLIRPQSLPSLKPSARSPKSKAPTPKSTRSANSPADRAKSPSVANSRAKSPAEAEAPKTPTPSASVSEAKPPETPNPKPPSPTAAGPPANSAADFLGVEVSPSYLETTQLPEESNADSNDRSNVYGTGSAAEPGTAAEEAGTAEDFSKLSVGELKSRLAEQGVEIPPGTTDKAELGRLLAEACSAAEDAAHELSSTKASEDPARTCSSAGDAVVEVQFESAAGHGLSAKGTGEGSSISLGVDRGVFRLRRQGKLLTFEFSPALDASLGESLCASFGASQSTGFGASLGGAASGRRAASKRGSAGPPLLYVGLDASGAPLLVRTGAEASAKRGVFREVPAVNGEGPPWISIEDAGMPGRYLEADGSEDNLDNATWKLVPVS